MNGIEQNNNKSPQQDHGENNTKIYFDTNNVAIINTELEKPASKTLNKTINEQQRNSINNMPIISYDRFPYLRNKFQAAKPNSINNEINVSKSIEVSTLIDTNKNSNKSKNDTYESMRGSKVNLSNNSLSIAVINNNNENTTKKTPRKFEQNSNTNNSNSNNNESELDRVFKVSYTRAKLLFK